ncbi:MAG: LysM peptidoglycan-binding domain-containing protein [Leptospiraceae bacterium]|nr:LysM peptidoglycan-binding domain-containing protein [Leptospiraceae bacterium]
MPLSNLSISIKSRKVLFFGLFFIFLFQTINSQAEKAEPKIEKSSSILEWKEVLQKRKEEVEKAFHDADLAFAPSLAEKQFKEANDLKSEGDISYLSFQNKLNELPNIANEKKESFNEAMIKEGTEAKNKWEKANLSFKKARENALASRNALIDSLSDIDEKIIWLNNTELDKDDRTYINNTMKEVSIGFHEISDGEIKVGYEKIESHRNKIYTLVTKYSPIHYKKRLLDADKVWNSLTTSSFNNENPSFFVYKNYYLAAEESLLLAKQFYSTENWDGVKRQLDEFIVNLEDLNERILVLENNPKESDKKESYSTGVVVPEHVKNKGKKEESYSTGLIVPEHVKNRGKKEESYSTGVIVPEHVKNRGKKEESYSTGVIVPEHVKNRGKKEETNSTNQIVPDSGIRKVISNYIVQNKIPPESLSEIAAKIYGKQSHWKKIYKANKNKIKDPNRIYPNQKLIIPKE